METMVSRRRFIVASAGLVAGVGLAGLAGRARAARAEETTYFEWREVAPGFFVALSRTGDTGSLLSGNATMAVKDGAALLIDTSQAVLGLTLRREAGAYGHVAGVVNTHHHFDHAGGNHAWTGDTPVHAHPNARQRLLNDKSLAALSDGKIAELEKLDLPGARDALKDARGFKDSLRKLKADAFAPTKLVENNPEMRLAGRKVRLIHVGPGHTDNDLILHFPDDNVVVTGDLVFNGYHPYFDPKNSGATSEGWLASLARVVSMCDKKTVLVPGHGEVGDAEAAKRQVAYFEAARAAVKKAIDSGKTREQTAAVTLDAYKDYKLARAQPLLMGGLYDEMVAPKPR